jgi:hypothetical protein
MRKKGRGEIVYLALSMDQIKVFKVQIVDLKRLGRLRREKEPEREDEQMKQPSDRESRPWVLNPGSTP